MEVTLLPDKRKGTIIGSLDSKTVKVRLEDGREVPWPVDRIQQSPKEGEETLKVVKIPAIDRLEELIKDRDRIRAAKIWVVKTKPEDKEFIDLFNQLRNECQEEFNKKWGLT